jgi:O-antigen ligase
MFQRRVDAAALINDGLSSQNVMQMFFTLVGFVWAINLIARHRVRVRDFVAGPAYWMSLLVLVYALSSIWSVWPALTLYRSIELGTFWVLSIHIFANRGWLENIERFLWITISLFWANGLLTGANTFFEGGIVSGIHDNAASAAAAATVLLTVFRITLDRTRRNWVKLIASTLSLVVFGSLSSTAALLCALAIFAGYYSFSNSRSLMMFVWCIVGGLTVFQVALFFLTDVSTLVSSGVTGAGAALNKTPEMLANWTGRVPLWIAIWDATKDTLWGDGFAAAERLFALNHPSFGWQARHSHNGYIAAWMGAGWIGFVLLLFVFGSVWIRSRRMVLTVRAMICSTLVLLAINNLTLAAIGGSFNPMFVLMMALTCVSPAYFARASHKTNDNFEPPVGTI